MSKFKVGQKIKIGKLIKGTDGAATHFFSADMRVVEVKLLTLGGKKLIIQDIDNRIKEIKISDYIIEEA
jgi:hypothetical protein